MPTMKRDATSRLLLVSGGRAPLRSPVFYRLGRHRHPLEDLCTAAQAALLGLTQGTLAFDRRVAEQGLVQFRVFARQLDAATGHDLAGRVEEGRQLNVLRKSPVP